MSTESTLRAAGGEAQGRAPAPPSTLRYTVLALLFTFLWATAFVAVKVALRSSPPFFLMASRFVVAGTLLLAYGRLRGQNLPGTSGYWARLAVLGLLNYALYLGLTAVALRHLSVGTGAVLASTNPLLLAVVAAWLLKERLTPRKVTGLLTSFAGVVWIMRHRMGDEDRPGSMALIMLAIALLVAGTILFKRWQLTQNLVQLLIAGAALMVPSLLFEPVGSVRLTASFLGAQAFLIFGVSCAGMGIWFWLLSHGDATRASAYFFLNPVLGLFLGALFIGEPLYPLDFVGSAAVALGIYLVQRP
jgi:drug/metabolite transporter (DMT)-like permease